MLPVDTILGWIVTKVLLEVKFTVAPARGYPRSVRWTANLSRAPSAGTVTLDAWMETLTGVDCRRAAEWVLNVPPYVWTGFDEHEDAVPDWHSL